MCDKTTKLTLGYILFRNKAIPDTKLNRVGKIFNILAASVGGGIMLGAGIRLGEAIVGREPGARGEGELAARLGSLENRLLHLEAGSAGQDPDTRVERQAAEVAAIRSELGRGEQQFEALSEMGLRLRTELRGWLEESVGARMTDVESRLKAEADRSQKQMLDAFAESVQTRVMQRISRLENEVAGQSAAMTELRDCSLRTEQSLQKLLGGLDRFIIPQPDPQAPPAATPSTAAEPAAPEPSVPEPVQTQPLQTEPVQTEPVQREPPPPEPRLLPEQRKPRRWSLFG